MNFRKLLGSVFVPLISALFVASSGAVTPVANQGALPSVQGALPPASQFLAEKPGFTSWRVLAQVELIKQDRKMVPKFESAVTALDGKMVKVQGFMMPLDIGDKQRRFLLVAAPPHCAFCLPAGPDAMIEVRAKSDIRYGFDVVALSGKLQVLKDDPAGLYYRIVDAVPTQ